MRIGVILQARMGSGRLPGKILKLIGEKPLLEHILLRLRRLNHSARLVVATTDLPQDDATEALCISHSVECFRGSELDVLDRYYQCANKYGFLHIVRLTGDNPFVDIEELDRLIDLHLDKGADYSHSFNFLPLGSGAEVFTLEALQRSHLKGKRANHREHVNEYIQENPELFRIEELHVNAAKNKPDVRLTVDTEEDYHRACFIVERCGDEYITAEKAIDLYSEFKLSKKE